MSFAYPVIIVGAGVVGLTLAQALKQHGIPFEIYERDEHIERANGWGITIHWALPALKACLPSELYDQLSTIQVDPQQGIKDTGRFLFLDLSNAEPKYVIPPAPRLRINRSKFRSLLAEGLDVNWNKQISGFSTSSGDGVEVKFSDGSSTKGSLLIGADGSASIIRQLLVGEEAGKLYPLPARFIGVTVRLSTEQMRPLRSIDPLLFQGCHPTTGVFLWFSTLSTPEVNGSTGDEEYYEGQLNMSWIVKTPADEIPSTDADKVAKMKQMAIGFSPVLKQAVDDIPGDSFVLEVKLQDWPTITWPTHKGKITLIGDAAHAMTMYRGEAANHGIIDAARLSEQLLAVSRSLQTLQEAVETYETEMQPRGHDAVLLSRQACLDAHDLDGLKPDSPLVSKRARVLKPGMRVE